MTPHNLAFDLIFCSQGLGALGLVGRGKRQAGDRFNPEATPFEWFTTNGESITKEECASRNATAEATGDPEQRISYRGPVFVQRGVVSRPLVQCVLNKSPVTKEY